MSENTTDETRGPVIPKSLTDAMRDAIASATFKAETLQQFNDLVGKVSELEGTVRYLREDNQKLTEDCRKYRDDVMKAEAIADKANEREHELTARENAVAALEQDKAVAVAVAAELRGVFNTIFANNQFRSQTIHSASPVAGAYTEQGNYNAALDAETTTTEGPA